jgi:colicin import membrane protein
MSIFVGTPGDYAGGGGYGGGYSPAHMGAYAPHDTVFGATMDPKALARKPATELTQLLKEQTQIFNLKATKKAAKDEAKANIDHINEALKKAAGGGAPAAASAAAATAKTPAAAAKAAAAAPAKPAAAPAKPAASTGVTRNVALNKVAQKAAVCDSSDVTQKLEADNTLISSLKDKVQEETNRAATINSKVKELKAALVTAESALQKARDELGGKTGEHEGATAALAEAEESVRTCSSSIASVDANVGKLGSGLATLQGEIEALTKHQDETLALLTETGAASKP